MAWNDELMNRLATAPIGGYEAGGMAAAETTALAALALLVHGRTDEAIQATDWLASVQRDDGSVPVTVDADEPGWTTGVAVLAWLATEGIRPQYRRNVVTALAWIESVAGNALPPNGDFGHDTTLVAWPWVRGTHSWIEPTALSILALKAAGREEQPRTRMAVRFLLDRQLPGGGCNFGNTSLYGQLTRPQVQPTGLALLGLAGESTGRARIESSLRYLEQQVGRKTTTVSLSWALLGLAAHGRIPAEAAAWLEAACRRTEQHNPSPHKYALIAHAALGVNSPLVALPAGRHSNPIVAEILASGGR
jgi:hypothetical protein